MKIQVFHCDTDFWGSVLCPKLLHFDFIKSPNGKIAAEEMAQRGKDSWARMGDSDSQHLCKMSSTVVHTCDSSLEEADRQSTGTCRPVRYLLSFVCL